MASLDKTCPKCGFTITPDLVKRVDFERIECPECGETFQPRNKEASGNWSCEYPDCACECGHKPGTCKYCYYLVEVEG